MRIAYAVEWVEVEFGMRPFCYRIYLDMQECIKDTIDCHEESWDSFGLNVKNYVLGKAEEFEKNDFACQYYAHTGYGGDTAPSVWRR